MLAFNFLLKMIHQGVPKISFALTLVLLLINIALLGYASYVDAKTITININTHDLKKVGNYGYLIDLDIEKEHKFFIRGDSRSHPNRSQLTLYIDGVELSSPHSVNKDVINKGNARYRHKKNNALLFSLPEFMEKIDHVETITANIRLNFPKIIVKAALFLLLISLLVLVYKILIYPSHTMTAVEYIGKILRLFFTACVGLYVLHIFTNMDELITITHDSIYYFAPALSFINDGLLDLLSGPEEQGHTFGFVYPALLTVFVMGGTINHIPFIQAILFLCTVGVFFYLIRHAINRKLSESEGVIFALAASIVMLSYFVYTKYTVEVMPEIVYQLSSLITIFILSLALTNRLSFKQLAIYTSLIIFFVTFNIHVKPHGSAIFLFVWICVILLVLFHSHKTKLKLPLLAVIALFAIVLFHYPNSYLNQYNSPGKTYGPRTLVCNHVNLIEPIIDKHIDDQDAVQFLRSDFQKTLNAPNDWELLGFSGDDCLLNLLTTQKLAERLDLTLEQQADLYTKLFISGILNSPLEYIGKIIKQYRFAISHPYPGRNSIVGRTEGESYLNVWLQREDFQRSRLKASYEQMFYSHPLTLYGFDFSWPGRAILNVLHELGLVIFIVFLLYLFFDVARLFIRKIHIEEFLRLWLLPLFSLLIYLAALSVVAVAHSFDVSRYVQFCSTYALYFQICAIGVFWYKYKQYKAKVVKMS